MAKEKAHKDPAARKHVWEHPASAHDPYDGDAPGPVALDANGNPFVDPASIVQERADVEPRTPVTLDPNGNPFVGV